MAKIKNQQWGILIILTVLVIGTLGSFAVMILAQREQSKLQAQYTAAAADFQKEQKSYQALVDAQTNQLSEQYYGTFSQYASQVGTYDLNSVKELSSEDLVMGDGEEVTGATKFAAYYIGWDANGHVFDQSIDTTSSKLKAPLSISDGLDNASLIDGWKEGMKGMHLGGVRLLTIPSDKAYKEQGMTDQSTGQVTIAPNMPLKFVVMAVPLPATVPQPEAYTQALDKYQKAYTALYGAA
jgi:FKBP-type peptidyl-prolyl cis-trans isomerase